MPEPGLWKLAPAVVTKPWGLLHESARQFTGISVGVGEFWLASAQTGAGNYSNTVEEPDLGRTLAELLSEAAEEGRLESLLGTRAVDHLNRVAHRGKTEAWYIRAVEGRAGVASGPRTSEDADRLKQIITTEGLEPRVESWPKQVQRLFGLIEPLEGGEVFLAPAGALHTMFAVGPESRLIIDEIQQGYGESRLPTLSKILCVQDDLLSVQVHPDDETVEAAATGRMDVDQDLQANPTVRLYDFGRRPGEYPELGFRLVDAEAGLRRVQPAGVELRSGHGVEVIVADEHFAKHRIRLKEHAGTGLEPLYGSYRVLHCLEGDAEVATGRQKMLLGRGETMFLPACWEQEATIAAEAGCVLFDDAFPNIQALGAWLAANGVPNKRIQGLLTPRRAL